MELNWTTFTLEIVNFLILVWILKRFLYRPVMDMIAQRRASIEEQSEQAEQRLAQAEALKQQYRGRLTHWQTERDAARETLHRELEAERARQLAELKRSLAEERHKAERSEAKQRGQQRREIEHRALEQGAAFASRILAHSCGPELEEKLLQRLLEDLAQLSPQQRQELFHTAADGATAVTVGSAYPLAAEQQRRLEAALNKAAGTPLSYSYLQQGELLAGLLVNIGAWVLRANVRDELSAFVEFAHGNQ